MSKSNRAVMFLGYLRQTLNEKWSDPVWTQTTTPTRIHGSYWKRPIPDSLSEVPMLGEERTKLLAFIAEDHIIRRGAKDMDVLGALYTFHHRKRTDKQKTLAVIDRAIDRAHVLFQRGVFIV